MKRLLFFIICTSFFIACVVAQPRMRDVFASMPDSLLPHISKNNRLDCIDFAENDMEACVRNAFDENVMLEVLTDNYARFRTSPAAYIEMKLLPLGDSLVLCTSWTAQTERLADSRLRFFTLTWEPLPLDAFFAMPTMADFCTGAVTEEQAHDAQRAWRSLEYFHPVLAALSPDNNSITLTMQTGDLDVDERRAAADMVQPVTLEWEGKYTNKRGRAN